MDSKSKFCQQTLKYNLLYILYTFSRQSFLRSYKLHFKAIVGILIGTQVFIIVLLHHFLQQQSTYYKCDTVKQLPKQLDTFQNTTASISATPTQKTSSTKICTYSRDLDYIEPTQNNLVIKRKLQNSELIWERSVAERHAWIALFGKNLSNVNPWDGENYVFFWNYFTPSFNCPHSVQRIGFIGDGGKWVCGLELYENEENTNVINKKSCIIYSFGVANESSFEAAMLNKTNCRVFAYDYSVKSIGHPVEPNHPRVTFKAIGIGNKNLGKFRTLKHLMEQNGHESIDILKMDIEGGEYAALDKVMEDFEHEPLPFGQLLLEVHVEGKIFPRFYRWWERLEARGLRAFHTEVNHVACAVAMVKPNFVEYSFLNVYGNHRLIS